MMQQLRLLLLTAACAGLTACPRSICGNGRVEQGESCDDGNTADGDGCATDCRSSGTGGGEGGGSSSGGGVGGGAAGGGGTAGGGGVSGGGGGAGGGGGSGGGGVMVGCGNGVKEGNEVCDDGNRVAADGCESDCMALTDTARIKGCPGLNQPVPAGERCAVTAGDMGRLITGIILTDGVTFVGGQILVDARGIITCAACDCSSSPGGTTAAQLVCPQTVVSPGLINAHDHISFQANPAMSTQERYEHRHDWREGQDGHTRINNGGNATNAQVRWAELRQLISGTTSIVGATYTSNGNAGLLRNLDTTPAGQQGNISGAAGVNSDTFPLDDTSGLELTSGCGYPSIPMAAPGTSAYLAHVSEGIERSAHNEFVCLSQASGVGILSARTGLVHGIGLKATDVALVAQTGTSLVWSPRSNVSLYGDTATIPLYHRLGVNIALGTDWTISGSMNLLRELRCADSLNSTRFGSALSDEALWRIVTANGAEATGSAASIGRLATGRLGDVALFKRKQGVSFFRSILEAEPQDVVMTMRGGKILYGDQALVAAFDTSMQCEALDVCGTMKAACVRGELMPLTGSNAANTLALLRTANASTYPLFACGSPPGEPSCVPERAATSPIGSNSKNGSTLYTQASIDQDKDGIPDAMDDCPSVFNPVRPMDNGSQADADSDGVGDACDVCPLDANTTTCTRFDPNDRDNDGVANGADNCPINANPMQADADSDGKGDACDPCPMLPNPGLEVCPVSIYDIKTGVVPVGQSVALMSVLVTGSGPNGYFLQVHESEPGYTGRDHSGLAVYQPASGVSAGDRLAIPRATTANFRGQIQLGGVGPVQDGGVRILSSGNAMPAPVPVNPADVVLDDGGVSTRLEGVLVRVDNVSVVDVSPDGGPGDRAPINEFLISGGLRVNDYLHLVTPFPVVGAQYQSILGVLEYRNGAFKIEPRSGADLITGPAIVTGLDPPLVFLREGQSTTLPQPLQVRLSNPELSDVVVSVTSSGTEVTVADGGLITVPMGQLSAVVPLSGAAATDGGWVTLTASRGASARTASVRVLGQSEVARLVALDPGTAILTAGATQRFTVRLDIPATAATDVTLSLVPNTLGVAPMMATVAVDQISATFDVLVDSMAAAMATGTVTATLGSDSVSAGITIQATPPTSNLVISEFAPRGPAGAFDEFVELYNPTGLAVDISGWKLQTKSALTTAWTDRVVFPGNTSIASHRYLLTGNSLASSGGYMGPSADFSWLNPANGLGDTGAVRLIRTVNQVDETVDAVAFGSTSIGGEGRALPPHPGSMMSARSFERLARSGSTEASMNGTGADVSLGNGQDTNNNAVDFYLRLSTVREPQNSASPAEP